MTDLIFPTPPLLFESYQTVGFSEITMISAISSFPGTDIELNRHLLYSGGFLLTTAFSSVPPVVSTKA